jgi:hypothetical protein
MRSILLTTAGWTLVLALGMAVLAPSAGAQAPNTGSPLLVLEPKPDTFQAEWIAPGPELHSDAVGQAFYLRRKFTTEHPESFNRVYVTADSQYILWVNGCEVFRGSARFDPQHHVYDTLDLSGTLAKGENTVAAMVMYWGLETNEIPYFQCSARPAFLFDSPELKSDATWRVLISPGHAGGGEKNTRGGGAAFWYERVDARALPAGFEQPGFDDASWARARILCGAEKWGDHTDTYTPWKLYPRRIPSPEMRPAESCAPVQSGVVEGTRDTPPFSFKVEADATVPSLPLTMPGDGKTHYLVLDAGCLINGYVALDVEGAAGDAVEVMYAEAPMNDGDKARRDVLGDLRVEGSNDSYIARDGRQIYEPFIPRTFRFVRVAVHATKAFTIHGLSYRWTGYPFVERGKFACSDEKLNKIWQTGWYTQRMCAFDTFQDCPYYERLQYGGDTRIQGLISLYGSGDARLLANAVRQLQASALPEGLIQSRYPNHTFQVIPGYSLCWIQMLDDYYQHTGDLELVRESAHTVDNILRFYERHITGQGFISNLPYWNFYDWTYEKSGVPDADAEDCSLSSMHYKGALDIGVGLFEALNDPLTAERYRGISKRMAEKINAQVWDEQAGLYRDGIATKTFSQHVNVFAVLFGLADEARCKRISERLFTDSALLGTTLYFAHYLHEAAERLGKPEYVIKDLERWQGMLDLGATTWWETPKDPRSECHAWSATPTYRLMEMVLGVRPASPGFEKVIIEPRTVGLTWAEGVVPTPHGDIKVRWEKGSTLAVDVTLPEGVTGEVLLPGGARKAVQSGSTRVTQ